MPTPNLGLTLLNDATPAWGVVNNNNLSLIDAYAAKLAPPGVIAFFASTTAPLGWLKLNGAAILVADYAALNTACYVGDALNPTAMGFYRCTNPAASNTSRATTGLYLALPDLRGEFLRGLDDGRGIDSGRIIGMAQGGQMEAHNHGINAYMISAAGTQTIALSSTLLGAGVTPWVGATVGGGETRPRNVAFSIFIKY